MFIKEINFKIINTIKLTRTIDAPVGVETIYEIYNPIIKVIIEITILEITTLLNFLNSCIEESVGKIIKLEISSAPTNRIPKTTIIEQRQAKIILYNSVLIPIDLANFSSNVIAKILL